MEHLGDKMVIRYTECDQSVSQNWHHKKKYCTYCWQFHDTDVGDGAFTKGTCRTVFIRVQVYLEYRLT